MPMLPTIEVTTNQANILLATFSGETDPKTGATLTPEQAYQRWLWLRLTEEVIARKTREIDNELLATRQQRLDTFRASLSA